MEQKDSSV